VLILQGQHQGRPPRSHLTDAPNVIEADLAVEHDVGPLAGQREGGLHLHNVVSNGTRKVVRPLLWSVLVGWVRAKEDPVGGMTWR
jgi:hypothetical protein